MGISRPAKGVYSEGGLLQCKPQSTEEVSVAAC